ncbi:MAG: hypothetical protein M1318_00740 [Firmicutes bacterium]|nr:hypothetical protein [Bacillota bacterium]
MPTDDRHEGVQRKVWMSETLNTTVEKLAASTNQSISAVLRQLISAGVQSEAQNEVMVQKMADAITAALMPSVSRVDHLERLTFFIAQNTAAERVAAEKGGELKAKSNFPNDPEKAHEMLMTARGEIKMMASERVRKALRGPKLTEEEN